MEGGDFGLGLSSEVAPRKQIISGWKPTKQLSSLLLLQLRVAVCTQRDLTQRLLPNQACIKEQNITYLIPKHFSFLVICHQRG